MIFKPKMCNLDLFLMFLVIFTLGQCCCWCAPREPTLQWHLQQQQRQSHRSICPQFSCRNYFRQEKPKQNAHMDNSRQPGRAVRTAAARFLVLHPFGHSFCSCSYFLSCSYSWSRFCSFFCCRRKYMDINEAHTSLLPAHLPYRMKPVQKQYLFSWRNLHQHILYIR